ncbi:hypothetical protein QBC32DRAFT_128650 [Pseudoneurospora amorphoporcata]|uniref:Uncharacterized protein n=1 Tax=Pseudoneurospora amorphoporcata TaxID=241081 RepID=A0AAN6SGX1_9PEZI|nr:hypothetical protein QBC32DRAFT_128650 [Pseudoneurospora amorphoporcata]
MEQRTQYELIRGLTDLDGPTRKPHVRSEYRPDLTNIAFGRFTHMASARRRPKSIGVEYGKATEKECETTGSSRAHGPPGDQERALFAGMSNRRGPRREY